MSQTTKQNSPTIDPAIVDRLKGYQARTQEAQGRADKVAVRLAPELEALLPVQGAEETIERTKRVLDAVETVNDAATAPINDAIECRKGCGFCCHQLLLVKAGEALTMRRAMKKLRRPARREIEQQAKAQMKMLRRAGYQGGQDWKNQQKMVQLGDAARTAGLPCPFLGRASQACVIYEDRAVPCRSAFAFERNLCKQHYGFQGKPPKTQYIEFGVIHRTEKFIPGDGSLIPACEVVLDDRFDP
ncbi:MAG: YkgJ family cysteine cluster protein [Pseudomonadota bacterium]